MSKKRKDRISLTDLLALLGKKSKDVTIPRKTLLALVEDWGDMGDALSEFKEIWQPLHNEKKSWEFRTASRPLNKLRCTMFSHIKNEPGPARKPLPVR